VAEQTFLNFLIYLKIFIGYFIAAF